MPTLPYISTIFYQHAATRSHLQPLSATCSHSIGCKWPPEQAAARGLWSKCMAATCSHFQPLEWPQVAAPDSSKQVDASGRSGISSKWPQVAAPASSRQVAASDRKWPLSAKSISSLKAIALEKCPHQVKITVSHIWINLDGGQNAKNMCLCVSLLLPWTFLLRNQINSFHCWLMIIGIGGFTTQWIIMIISNPFWFSHSEPNNL